MASTWSSLGIRLMTTGENANAWGDQTNQNWERLEDAADGLATVAVTGATTLTFTPQPTSYADENGRNKVLVFTGTAGGTQAITFPNIEKTYHVLNDSNSTLTLTTGTGAATVSLEAGKDKMIYNDGSDEIHDALANLAITTLDISSTLQVDGAITSSAGATITVADNSDTLTLKSTDADASVGPILALTRDSSSPADNDIIGRIEFRGDDDGGNITNFLTIDTRIADATNGSEDFKSVFSGIVAGTERHVFTLGSTEAVFNDGSQDIDFRVESNANTHMLFVDGNNDHVNMGTSTAYAGKLNIETDDNSFNLFLVSTDADANAGPNMKFYRNSGSPADNDITGNIHFTGRNDNSQDVDYAHIETLISDASDGTEDGYMNIYVAHAGTQARSRIEMDSTEMVINEGGADLDFRVESDANANRFKLDAGDDVIVMGTGTVEDSIYGAKPALQLTGTDFNSSAFSIIRNSADASSPNLIFGKSRSADGNTVVQNGDDLGNITFAAADGTDQNNTAARIYAEIDGAPGANDTPGRLVFATTADGSNSATERLRIDSSGNVGIGTSSPSANLHVDSSSGGLIRISRNATSTANYMALESDGTNGIVKAIQQLLFSAGGSERMRIDSSGAVGIGTSAPAEYVHTMTSGNNAIRVSGGSNNNKKVQIGYDGTNGPYIAAGSSGIVKLQFYVDNTTLVGEFRDNGDFYTNDGTVHSLSDVRIKSDINDLTDGLEIVKQLKPRTFKYTSKSQFYSEKDKDEIKYGFVADEVEEVASQYISIGTGKIDGKTVDDLKSISAIKMIPMLVKAIQELEAKVTALENN